MSNDTLLLSLSLTITRENHIDFIVGQCREFGWSYPTEAEFAAMSTEDLDKLATQVRDSAEEARIDAAEQQDLWNMENEEFGNDPDEGFDPYSNSYTDDC
jgi:hypothetical protein